MTVVSRLTQDDGHASIRFGKDRRVRSRDPTFTRVAGRAREVHDANRTFHSGSVPQSNSAVSRTDARPGPDPSTGPVSAFPGTSAGAPDARPDAVPTPTGAAGAADAADAGPDTAATAASRDLDIGARIEAVHVYTYRSGARIEAAKLNGSKKYVC